MPLSLLGADVQIKFLGMDQLTQAIQEAKRRQIFTYEAVHEVIQKMTGNVTGPVGQAPESWISFLFIEWKE
jgi:hypothetical protein